MNDQQQQLDAKKGPPLANEVIILTPEPGNSGLQLSVSGTSNCAPNTTVTIVLIDNNGQLPPATHYADVDGDNYWSTVVPMLNSGNVTILAYCTGQNPVTGSSVSNLHYQEEGASFKPKSKKLDKPVKVNLGDFDPINDCIFVMEKTVDPKKSKQSKKDASLKIVNPSDLSASNNKYEYSYEYLDGYKNLVRIIFSNGGGQRFNTVTFFTHNTDKK